MNSGSPATFGAILGIAIALALLIPNFWIVVLLAFVGFAVGKLWESQELRGKVKEILSHLFS